MKGHSALKRSYAELCRDSRRALRAGWLAGTSTSVYIPRRPHGHIARKIKRDRPSVV